MTGDASSNCDAGDVIDLFPSNHTLFEDPVRDLGPGPDRERVRVALSALHVAHDEICRRVYPALRRRVVDRARAEGLLTT